MDCNLVESRVISIPDYCTNWTSPSALVGKDFKGDHYNGSLQSVRIIASSEPLQKQCPSISSDEGENLGCYLLITLFPNFIATI